MPASGRQGSEMSRVCRQTTQRRVSWWAAFCLTGGAISGTWWLSGIGRYRGPDHMVGPYAMPVGVEYGVGILALACAVVATVVSVVRPAARFGVSALAMAPLLVAVIIATGAWRVITAGGDGANIGGGIVAILAPFAVAGLLFATLAVERRSRHGMMRYHGGVRRAGVGDRAGSVLDDLGAFVLTDSAAEVSARENVSAA